MKLDKQQLFAKFATGFDVKDNQVLTTDKVNTTVDKTQPWVRFSVAMGDRFIDEVGARITHLQQGMVYLQVFVPRELGSSGGDDLIERFDNLFREWRSADGCLNVGRTINRTQETPHEFQHTIGFAWASRRALPQ